MEGARVEWPGGRALRVREPLDSGHLSLRVATEPDGFLRATGDPRLGKKESLELGRLLDLLEASPGRFLVRLDEDDFVALTRSSPSNSATCKPCRSAGARRFASRSWPPWPWMDGSGQTTTPGATRELDYC